MWTQHKPTCFIIHNDVTCLSAFSLFSNRVVDYTSTYSSSIIQSSVPSLLWLALHAQAANTLARNTWIAIDMVTVNPPRNVTALHGCKPIWTKKYPSCARTCTHTYVVNTTCQLCFGAFSSSEYSFCNGFTIIFQKNKATQCVLVCHLKNDE